MLKLISLNIETNKHYEKILPFFIKENPDVICLQEAPESFSTELQKLGFETYFAPMFLLDDLVGEDISEVGLLIASKFPFEAKANYYHKPAEKIIIHERENLNGTVAAAYIFFNIKTPKGIYNIATTHPLKTENGPENEFQNNHIKSMLSLLSEEPPHIICGDFNIPRGYNSNYIEMTNKYSDNIPGSYCSSLDRNIHRLGKEKISRPIFDIYMVDYIFTQPPYQAENVRLEFGVSDHAGIVAEIQKTS
jgi:endonuclease/exonuclease/phosphatase family metal-dependent hydrolase